MGNKLSPANDHYEIENKTDGFFTYVDVKSEEIHEVLNSLYVIITSNKPFHERRKELRCIYQKVKPLINIYLPHIYQFVKDCYGYEYFIFIGTIGYYAVDVVLYFDLKDWISLNTGSTIRSYHKTGTSRLQYSVTQRLPPSTSDEVKIMEHRKREIDDIIKHNRFEYGPHTIVDFRCKPKIRIVQPKNDEVLYDDQVEVRFDVYNLTLNDQYIKVYLDGCEVASMSKPEPVRLHLKRPGYHKIDVKVIDKYDRLKIKDSVRVLYDYHNSDDSKTTDSMTDTGSEDVGSCYHYGHHNRGHHCHRSYRQRHRRHNVTTGSMDEDSYDGCQSDDH